jgi:hypothetical protein
MEENTESAATGHAHTGPGCFFCTTARPMLEHFWSEATRDHFRNSRVEFLKGIRSLIDQRIASLSSKQERKGTHVTVE